MMKQKMAINLWIYRSNIKLFADLIVILLIIDSSGVVGHSTNIEQHHHYHNNNVCNHQHPKAHEVSCLILTLLVLSLSILFHFKVEHFIAPIGCNHVWFVELCYLLLKSECIYDFDGQDKAN